jgi:hypothetical protein
MHSTRDRLLAAALVTALTTGSLVLTALSACASREDPPGAADAGATSIRINEVSGAGAGFVEIYNAGAIVFDVGGWKVAGSHTDGGTPNDPFTLPPGPQVPPGGFLVVMGFQEAGVSCAAPQGVPCFLGSFSISNANGETIYLLTPASKVADSTEYPAGKVGKAKSWGRLPDGTGSFDIRTPTVGEKNAP